jgi:hypothetical protein
MIGLTARQVASPAGHADAIQTAAIEIVVMGSSRCWRLTSGNAPYRRLSAFRRRIGARWTLGGMFPARSLHSFYWLRVCRAGEYERSVDDVRSPYRYDDFAIL